MPARIDPGASYPEFRRLAHDLCMAAEHQMWEQHVVVETRQEKGIPRYRRRPYPSAAPSYTASYTFAKRARGIAGLPGVRPAPLARLDIECFGTPAEGSVGAEFYIPVPKRGNMPIGEWAKTPLKDLYSRTMSPWDRIPLGLIHGRIGPQAAKRPDTAAMSGREGLDWVIHMGLGDMLVVDKFKESMRDCFNRQIMLATNNPFRPVPKVLKEFMPKLFPPEAG